MRARHSLWHLVGAKGSYFTRGGHARASALRHDRLKHSGPEHEVTMLNKLNIKTADGELSTRHDPIFGNSRVDQVTWIPRGVSPAI